MNVGRSGFIFSNVNFDQIRARYILALIACVAGVTLLPDFANAQATSTSIRPGATLGLIAQNVSQPITSAVQSQIQSIRDAIFSGRERPSGTAGARPFAPIESQDNSNPISGRLESNPLYAEPFYDALGYAKNDGRNAQASVLKAPPKASAGPVVSAWVQGFGDFEKHTGVLDGVDIGSKASTGGGVAGADVILRNIWGSDAMVFGILGGGVSSHVSNNDGSTATVRGPSAGVYAMWIKGGFSTDLTFKDDFLTLDASTLPASARLNNYVTSWNANYRQEYGPWWMEPTVGVNYTRSVWHSQFNDGDTWRLQGGARVGTVFNWNGMSVSPVLTALIYDDVSVRGATLATAVTSAPSIDQGKLAGKLNGKLNFEHGNGLTSFVEAEVRGHEHMVGVLGTVGLRRQF